MWQSELKILLNSDVLHLSNKTPEKEEIKKIMKTKYVMPRKLPSREECFYGLFANNEEAHMAHLIVTRCQRQNKWIPFFAEAMCDENGLDISFVQAVNEMQEKGLLIKLKDGSFIINGNFLALFN